MHKVIKTNGSNKSHSMKANTFGNCITNSFTILFPSHSIQLAKLILSTPSCCICHMYVCMFMYVFIYLAMVRLSAQFICSFSLLRFVISFRLICFFFVIFQISGPSVLWNYLLKKKIPTHRHAQRSCSGQYIRYAASLQNTI